MSEERENQEEKKTFEKHLYGVIYLDVLGQRELINKFAKNKASVDDEKHLQKVLQHISRLLNRLQQLKRYFTPENAKQIYNDFSLNAQLLDSAVLLEGVTPERIEKSLKEISFGIQQFSDTTLLYARLDGKDPYMARHLFGFLIAMLPEITREAFAKGIFFRGSITVGDAWEINENNLYGPAVHKAYTLEERVARWPRIVLSPSATSFFKEDYKILAKILPENNLTRSCAKSTFIWGMDGIPQIDLVPKSAYYVICLLKKINEQEMFRKILNEIREQINQELFNLTHCASVDEITEEELSKRIARYRILKRDLLIGWYQFELTCHVYNTGEKKDFTFPNWVIEERDNDLGFLTSTQELFNDILTEDIEIKTESNV